MKPFMLYGWHLSYFAGKALIDIDFPRLERRCLRSALV